MKFEDSILSQIMPQTSTTHVIRDKKYILVYISARWSAQCQEFTSKLIDVYRKKSDRCRTEVAFISLDRTICDYNEHCEKMPWILVPYDNAFRYRLFDTCKVDTIPSIFLFDDTGMLVSRNDFSGFVNLFHPQRIDQVEGDIADVLR